MTNCRAETRVVLISDAADPSFHFVAIPLIKILNDIKLHIAPSLRRETINRVDVADSLERLTHQHKTFFLDLDNPAPRSRVGLQRMTANSARRRRRLVQQERDRHVATPP